MDREPVEIGQQLRCRDWTRRVSDTFWPKRFVGYHLKFMKVGCGSAIYTEFEYSSLDWTKAIHARLEQISSGRGSLIWWSTEVVVRRFTQVFEWRVAADSGSGQGWRLVWWLYQRDLQQSPRYWWMLYVEMRGAFAWVGYLTKQQPILKDSSRGRYVTANSRPIVKVIETGFEPDDWKCIICGDTCKVCE